MNIKKTYNITIAQNVIPRSVFNAIYKFVNSRDDDYASMTAQKMTAIVARLDGWCESYISDTIDAPNASICANQIASIRSALLKQRIIAMHSKVLRALPRALKLYEARENILNIAARLGNLPPMALLRVIMRARYPDAPMRQLLNGDMSLRDSGGVRVLDTSDIVQIARVQAADAETISNNQHAGDRAAENERRFVEYFTRLDIALQTQDDIIAADSGRAILTPDILFTDDVTINGMAVRWIDFKDYVGCDVGFISRGNRAQASKYIAKFGPGAIAYGLSYVDGFELIEGCMIIDASMLVQYERDL